MIGRGGLEVRIDVGIGPRVLNGVIGECLVKIHSIATMFTPRQGVNKILNFSDPILRKSLDFPDLYEDLKKSYKSREALQKCALKSCSI